MVLKREEKERIIKEFKKHEQDTGSPDVQVALLTKNIHFLTDHCQKNPKDFSSKRGLIKMVSERRRLLNYIQHTNEAKYKEIIERLGLRK
jgi:small subunit ribosomal protein S15